MKDEGEGDEEVAALLRAAGRRETAPELVAGQVRATVHAEWAATVAARRRRRRTFAGLALAASVGMVAVGAWLARPVAVAPGSAARVATLVRVDGAVESGAGAAWQPATAAAPLAGGTSLRTGSGGRAALAWSGGGTIRVDAGSQLRVEPDRVVLERGAVYADGEGAGLPRIETPLGAVRHLGTRYEARLASGALRVTVRDGRVAIERDGAAIGTAAGGERVTVAADGRATRSAVPAWSAEWAWLDAVVPPFEIEGRSLAEFVDWAARETGRQARYAGPAVEADARRVILHGSVAGLAPADALRAVLATTHLHADLREGEVVVARRDDTT